MQKLKSMIKKAINSDHLDICKHNNPTSQDFSFVIHSYQSMSFESKRLFSESLFRKLSRPNQNKQVLNLLILCDFLSGTNPQIFHSYPKKLQQALEQKKKIKAWTKQEKLNLAETNFVYFYLEYLREKVWSQASHMDNLSFNTLQDGIIYCQSAINALKLILRYDFIIEYTLINSQLKNQTKISLQNILRRSSEDLAILIKFVDKWSPLIIQDRPQSLMVNDIYEQLIYISKNISKLEYLRNKIKANIALPRYQLNKNLNLTIQMSMRGRESERISFYSQKRLKTDGDTNEDQAEITQTQIFMKFKL